MDGLYIFVDSYFYELSRDECLKFNFKEMYNSYFTKFGNPNPFGQLLGYQPSEMIDYSKIKIKLKS